MSRRTMTLTENGDYIFEGFKGGQGKVHTFVASGTFDSGTLQLQCTEQDLTYDIAEGTIVTDATILPSDGDLVIIGDATYEFVDTLADAFDVLIPTGTAATSEDALTNLLAAIEGDTLGAGTVFHDETPVNDEVTGAIASDTLLVLTAAAAGPDGNDIALSTDVTGWTTEAFAGGDDDLANWLPVLSVTGSAVSLTSGAMRNIEMEAERIRVHLSGATSPEILVVIR